MLSSYPYDLAIAEGYLDANGTPVANSGAYSSCASGYCAAWIPLQGTSMASPHVAGEAALVIARDGHRSAGGYSLRPNRVQRIIERTATDHPCPAGGVEIYTDEGRPAEWNDHHLRQALSPEALTLAADDIHGGLSEARAAFRQGQVAVVDVDAA